MKNNETNSSQKIALGSVCSDEHSVPLNEKVSNKDLLATHDVDRVDSSVQLKELAQALSAAIEIVIGTNERESDSPSTTSSKDTLKNICNYRSEFEGRFARYLDPEKEDQRWLINALHKHIVGNDSVADFQMSDTPLSTKSIDMYFNHFIRSQILTLSQAFIIPLFASLVENRSSDPDTLFRVWFNQIVAITCDAAASMSSSGSSICIDCLSKETLFRRIRKVIRNFASEQTRKSQLRSKEPIAAQKRLFKILDQIVASVTEDTFYELANEFGEFKGDFIEIRNPNENEIN